MDGAGLVEPLLLHRRCRTWPAPITVVILIETIFLLGVFAEIFVTTGGGPGYATTNLAFLIYTQALLAIRCRRRLGRRHRRRRPRQHRRHLPDAHRSARTWRHEEHHGTRCHRPARKTVTTRSLAWAVGLLIFFPILWTLLTSFKTEAEAIAVAAALHRLRLDAGELRARCRSARTTSGIFMNSVIISVGSTLLGLLIAVPAAWSMAFVAEQAHQGHPDVDALDQDDAGGRRAGADLSDLPRHRPARHAHRPRSSC